MNATRRDLFLSPSINELPDFLSDAPVSVVLHCNSGTVHQRIARFLVGRCFVLIAKILPVQTCKDLCVVQGTGAGKNASQLLKASCASYAQATASVANHGCEPHRTPKGSLEASF